MAATSATSANLDSIAHMGDIRASISRNAMKTISLRSLASKPDDALAAAREGLVVVQEKGHPAAVMVGLGATGALDLPGVRAALATALFRDGQLALTRAARVAQMPLAEFVAHLSRLGVPVVSLNAAETALDLDTLDAWLA